MKSTYIFCLIFLFLFLLGCTAEKKNPIEGTWELVSAKWATNDTTFLWPTNEYARHIKTFTRTRFSWIRQDTSFKENALLKDNYGFGGGKYALNGDNYTEHIEMWINPKFIGNSLNYTVKIKGDTLTQSGMMPLEKWGYGESDYKIYEVYKRLD